MCTIGKTQVRKKLMFSQHLDIFLENFSFFEILSKLWNICWRKEFGMLARSSTGHIYDIWDGLERYLTKWHPDRPRFDGHQFILWVDKILSFNQPCDCCRPSGFYSICLASAELVFLKFEYLLSSVLIDIIREVFQTVQLDISWNNRIISEMFHLKVL